MIFKHRKRKIKNKTKEFQHAIFDFIESENKNIFHGQRRIPVSIKRVTVLVLFGLILSVSIIIFAKTYDIQVVNAERYKGISENNIFERKIVFSDRGNILDRNGERLVENIFIEEEEYELRKYPREGFGNLLGYVRYPRKDVSGNYFRTTVQGVSGIEEFYDNNLRGENGSLIYEKNSKGEIINELFVEYTKEGEDQKLSIDKNVQEILYKAISETAEARGFRAGAGAIMDVDTGELIALVTHPDFNSNILSNGTTEEKQKYLLNKNGVLVNRAVSGLYTPGSTVKPFFSVAAIDEDILDPNKIITSTGQISIQSAFDPDVVYVFKDWREHGPINLFEAIAWSSNVYFYHIGGGYKDFKGLGIENLYFYTKLFALEEETKLGITSEPNGIVPNPEWKERLFDEEWRLGDTYNTVIGQYGFQVTPLQLLRGISAIANGGYLVEPHLEYNETKPKKKIAVSKESINVTQKGMRQTVTIGTATALNFPDLKLAVKSGTAEIGDTDLVNSLITGFYPYDNPRYAFIVIIERGLEGGGLSATLRFFKDLKEKAPEYWNL